MNVVLIVVDSLRSDTVERAADGKAESPFFGQQATDMIYFRRAYATECWTLPTHMSFFTGLLPSQHGAHFQTMAYRGTVATVAEVLAKSGYATELVSRNPVLDGTIEGVARGFMRRSQPMARSKHSVQVLPLLVALAKPRIRRMLRKSGFVHCLQYQNRRFLANVTRIALPADREALALALERMAFHRRRGSRYFLFLNLYDVHLPYAPSERSLLRSAWSRQGIREGIHLALALPKILTHGYLRPRFRLSATTRQILAARYHQAVELMDRKLADFYREALASGLLDDTLLVITSDHGEAFGEHGLYYHDASVYDVHLHVPLWIRYPGLPAAMMIDDVVSTKDLFALLCRAAEGQGHRRTVLDADHRRENPVALAEHFHYPHTDDLAERYKHNIAAAIVGRHKVIARREGLEYYDVSKDPEELAPEQVSLQTFRDRCRREGISEGATDVACGHLCRLERRAHAA